jgi:ribokinase
MSDRSAQIAVVGSYAVGMTMRASRAPVPGETVEGRDFGALHGGKGSNQAVACARLSVPPSARVLFLCCIGKDASGDAALELYAKERVDTSLIIRRSDLATGVGFIIVEDSGENLIVVDFGANRALSPQDVRNAADRIGAASVVMTQLEIEPETAAEAMRVGKEKGATTILNPAPYRAFPASAWQHVDIVTPNATEARLIIGLPVNAAAEPESLAERIRALGVSNVVITLGSRGAYVLSAGFTGLVSGWPVNATDTTGAGDTFAGALAVAISEKRPLREAVSFAAAAAAISVTRYGVIPSIPDRKEVDEMISCRQRGTLTD